MATQIAVPPVRFGGLRVRPLASSPHWDERRLVVKLIPLVKRVAMKMRERLPMHIELDDLISTGVLGLVDAVQKFDPGKQVKLEQYAQHRIRGAILDGLRELDGASRDLRKKSKSAERAYGELEAKLGRPPRDPEMAKSLGVSLAGWYRTVRDLKPLGVPWLRPLASVGIKEISVTSGDDIPADNEGHQFDACYRREQKEILCRALGRIPKRERQVIQMYYQQAFTMREIGARIGLDESRVSQLHSSALVHLRKHVGSILEKPVPAVPRLAW